MKDAKTILIILLVVLILGGMAVASIVLEKPWWLGPVLAIGLAASLVAVWLMFMGLKKAVEWLWANRPVKPAWAEALSKRWKEASGELRGSRLKDRGDPFYVLPWYLVIGPSGAGKSSALCRSGLSPQPGMSLPKLGKTENCEWHFLEEAVVLDTAGRYAVHENQVEDAAEWRLFLKLLSKRRSREPLNGLVAVAAADVLLDASRDEIEKAAAGIGAALRDLEARFGAAVPVYVMITKCDLIRGMEEFASSLPSDKLSGAMGRTNRDGIADPDAFAEAALDSAAGRLKSFRAAMSLNVAVDPDAFFFPDELLKMKPGLKIFVERIFQGGTYEDALLRGVFLTSAMRGEAPRSRLAGGFEAKTESEEPPADRGGIFIRDLFSRTFPADRELSAASGKKSFGKKAAGHLWRLAGVMLIALLILKLHQAYRRNLVLVSRAASELENPVRLDENAGKNLEKLEKLAETIDELSAGRGGSFPDAAADFALNRGKEIGKLKELYCRLYGIHIVSVLKRRVREIAESPSGEAPQVLEGGTVMSLARRVNLLNALEKADELSPETIQALPRPDGAFEAERLGASPKLGELAERLYARHLLWEKAEVLALEKQWPAEMLKEIAERPNGSLNWMVALADRSAPEGILGAESFWKGSRESSGAPIPFSATAEGKQWMDAALDEVDKALPGSGILARKIAEFKSWRRERFFRIWLNFVSDFFEGRETLRNYRERERAVSVLGSEVDPWLLLSAALTDNARAFEEKGAEFPKWVRWMLRFEDVRENLRKKESAEKSNSLIYKTRLGRVLKKTSGRGSLTESTEALRAALKLLKESRREVMESGRALAERTFRGDKESPVLKTRRVFGEFLDTMPVVDALSIDRVLESFVRGPLDFLWEFAVAEAGRGLQKSWEEKVLPASFGKSFRELKERDPVRDFVESEAGVFLRADAATGKFLPVSALGRAIRFDPAFPEFLRLRYRLTEVLRRSHEMTISFLPTEVVGGGAYAELAHLEISSAGEVRKLSNYQNVTSKSLMIDLSEKIAVLLRASVGGLTLTRKYEGEEAFFDFVRDFKSGARSFRPGDFPSRSRSLRKLGVRRIDFHIEPRGERELMETLVAGRVKPPRRIVLEE